jgi:hypothetical protein
MLAPHVVFDDFGHGSPPGCGQFADHAAKMN